MTIHFLEITVGRPSDAPSLVKQAIRFGRRLRRHHIYHAAFPSWIDGSQSVCRVAVGRRVVNIFSDGSHVSSLRNRDGQYDNKAFDAQSNRMHALYLGLAQHARSLGFPGHARGHLELATQERQSYERSRTV